MDLNVSSSMEVKCFVKLQKKKYVKKGFLSPSLSFSSLNNLFGTTSQSSDPKLTTVLTIVRYTCTSFVNWRDSEGK